MSEVLRRVALYCGLMTTSSVLTANPSAEELLAMIHAACMTGDVDMPDQLFDYLDEFISRNPL